MGRREAPVPLSGRRSIRRGPWAGTPGPLAAPADPTSMLGSAQAAWRRSEVFRFVIYAATDQEAHALWERFHALAKEDGRETRARLGSAAEALTRYRPDELPVVAGEDSREHWQKVVWSGSVPADTQLREWARTIPTQGEIVLMMEERAARYRAERANPPKTLDEAVRRVLDDLTEAEGADILDMALHQIDFSDVRWRDLCTFDYRWRDLLMGWFSTPDAPLLRSCGVTAPAPALLHAPPVTRERPDRFM